MDTKNASIILGIIFIAVGLLGFIPNPIIGGSHDALFHANTLHNNVHIISGTLFLIVGLVAPASASTFLKIFGVIYFLLGVLGLINFGTDGMGELLGFLHVNGPDNLLHIALGAVIFMSGTMLPMAKIDE